MEAHHHNLAIPCRCGGQAKIFGPSSFAPTSHWGVYCSRDDCEKLVIADNMELAIEHWNEEQMLETYCL